MIAADVVLLPSRADMQKIIDCIEYTDETPIRLHADTCMPHISLAMGVLDRVKFEQARESLQKIARALSTVECTIAKFDTHTTPDGKVFCDADILKTTQMAEMQVAIMEQFSEIFTQTEANIGMFYSPPAVAKISPHWVNVYYEINPEKFRPHITMGEGVLSSSSSSFTFTAHRLALVHMGSYCTCREIIYEDSLK